MLTDDMQLISVDDHLIEPPNVWQDRLPERYREAGPRIVEVDSSNLADPGAVHSDQVMGAGVEAQGQVWCLEGRLYPQIALNAVAGKPWEERGVDPLRYDDMLPGCYDPVERVRDMDRDGVHVQMCFPTFPRFAGTLFLECEDRTLAGLCTRAWNDYILDEWWASAPDRFIPMVILPFWDVDASVAEIERTAAKGARVISFPESMEPLGQPSFHTGHWDRLFDAATAAGLPLSMHFGTSGRPPITASDAPLATMIALMGTNSMCAMVDLLFSPVFQRHPDLEVVLAEGGIGWMPYMLERVDATWERQRFYNDIDQTRPPSEAFARHIYGCFISDEFGVAHREAIGVDRLLWEGDYPHSDSNWPNSRKVLAEQMRDVPDADVHRMVELNARELFNFPRS